MDGFNLNCLKSDPVIIKSVENEDRLEIRSQHFWSDPLAVGPWSGVLPIMMDTLCLGGLREWERRVETRKWQEG